MDEIVYGAAQHGALGCLLEIEHEQRLMLFLNGLKNDPKWTDAQIDSIADKIRDLLQSAQTDDGKLSSREDEVLRLIAEGHTNKEIAAMFDLSAKTIETYKTRAAVKLGIKRRAEIVQYAQKRGWL